MKERMRYPVRVESADRLHRAGLHAGGRDHRADHGGGNSSGVAGAGGLEGTRAAALTPRAVLGVDDKESTMIDRIGCVVRDLARSRAFYEAALVPPGYAVLMAMWVA
jgi:hypothetical protein